MHRALLLVVAACHAGKDAPGDTDTDLALDDTAAVDTDAAVDTWHPGAGCALVPPAPAVCRAFGIVPLAGVPCEILDDTGAPPRGAGVPEPSTLTGDPTVPPLAPPEHDARYAGCRVVQSGHSAAILRYDDAGTLRHLGRGPRTWDRRLDAQCHAVEDVWAYDGTPTRRVRSWYDGDRLAEQAQLPGDTAASGGCSPVVRDAYTYEDLDSDGLVDRILDRATTRAVGGGCDDGTGLPHGPATFGFTLELERDDGVVTRELASLDDTDLFQLFPFPARVLHDDAGRLRRVVYGDTGADSGGDRYVQADVRYDREGRVETVFGRGRAARFAWADGAVVRVTTDRRRACVLDDPPEAGCATWVIELTYDAGGRVTRHRRSGPDGQVDEVTWTYDCRTE